MRLMVTGKSIIFLGEDKVGKRENICNSWEKKINNKKNSKKTMVKTAGENEVEQL